MKKDFYIISTYPERVCGVGTFTRDFTNALGKFSEKVGKINIAAINDKDSNYYAYPVTKEIKQYDPDSWSSVTQEIISENKNRNVKPTIILQHEYGIDPADDGEYGKGINFVRTAKQFYEESFPVISYLHTVKEEPEQHHKEVLRDLSKYSDGLVVTANKAVKILSSSNYGVDPAKLKHIDHGTRDFSREGRDEVKEKYGLGGVLLYTTMGMKGKRKGLESAVEAWGKFLNEKVSNEDRSKLCYLIAGGYHPNAVKQGFDLEYDEILEKSIKKSNLKHLLTQSPSELGSAARDNDLVLLEPPVRDHFLSEQMLIDLYTMSNGVPLLYPGKDQISSGILADTVGSKRVAITTKFLYAKELLLPEPEKGDNKGIIGIDDPSARGILVDFEDVVNQTSEAFDYLTYNENSRIHMESMSTLRGYEMRWQNVVENFLKYLEVIGEKKKMKQGKDPVFRRK